MTKGLTGVFKPIRRDRLIQERRHDTYRSHGKLKEPTVCPGCGAVYRKGMWHWESAPAEARQQKCPACLRIEDDYPAGRVSLSGRFLEDHGDELLGLVRNEESRKKSEHALERIMRVDQGERETVITTTDIHLARRIGEAVHHAYAGELDYHYEEGENRLRVNWWRDE